jgi:hypothetical protein
MRRREFLWTAGGAAFAGKPASVLVHEHVLVDFVGADQIRPGRYDRDEVFRIARPNRPCRPAFENPGYVNPSAPCDTEA